MSIGASPLSLQFHASKPLSLRFRACAANVPDFFSADWYLAPLLTYLFIIFEAVYCLISNFLCEISFLELLIMFVGRKFCMGVEVD